MASSFKYLLAFCLFFSCCVSFASQELTTAFEEPIIPSGTTTRNGVVPESSRLHHVSLAAEDGWPPFADQYGKGVSHRLIHAAFKQVDVSVSTIVVPYSRGLRMASEGSVEGVFNVAKLKPLKKDYFFGQQALFISHSLFFQSKSQPLLAKNKYQLNGGTRIGKVKGFYYGGEIHKLTQVEFVEVENQYQLINLLLANRIDGALMYQEVAQRYIEQMKVSDEIIPAFENHRNPIYLAFSRQIPHGKKLAATFDIGLKQLKQNGRYQQILSGYAEGAP